MCVLCAVYRRRAHRNKVGQDMSYTICVLCARIDMSNSSEWAVCVCWCGVQRFVFC